MAGYLLPSSKLDVEPLLHLPSDPQTPVPYPSKVCYTPHHNGGPNAMLTTILLGYHQVAFPHCPNADGGVEAA